jgi:hypothetical protein
VASVKLAGAQKWQTVLERMSNASCLVFVRRRASMGGTHLTVLWVELLKVEDRSSRWKR